MTAKCAIAMALLEGKVINIKNSFTLFGVTNAPREIGRAIERDPEVTKNPDDYGFGVEVSRTPRTGVSRYERPCIWTDYRLNRTSYNAPGIAKMREYIKKELGSREAPKTSQQAKDFRQTNLFLESL